MIASQWNFLGQGCYKRRPVRGDELLSAVSVQRTRIEVLYDEPGGDESDRLRSREGTRGET